MYQTPSERTDYHKDYYQKNKARIKEDRDKHKEETKIKRKDYFANYRKENRDKINAKSHHHNTTPERKARRIKFYAENKELDKYRTRRAYLKRTFNITLEQYEDMVKSQGDCCAICGKHRTKNGKRLAVDHCHITGQVRNLLCSMCNKSLGGFKDDINMLIKATEYLKKHNTPQDIIQAEYMI